MSCTGIVSAAAEKHLVLSGTFGKKIKPTPVSATCERRLSGAHFFSRHMTVATFQLPSACRSQPVTYVCGR